MRAFLLLGIALTIGCGGIVEPPDARTTDASSPATPVPGLPIVDVAGGGDELCALRADGAVFCLDSSKGADELVPSRLADLPSSQSISVVRGYGCSVTESGEVWCWGEGPHASSTKLPSRVPLGKAARQVACGDEHSCALTVDGEVLCWGSNTQGQLGSTSAGAQSKTPVAVELSGMRATQLTAGTRFSCAATENGSVRCWGSNGLAELGIGSRQASSSVPVVVRNIQDVRRLRSGSSTSCVVEAGDRVQCWGVEGSGQRGPDGIDGLAYEPRIIAGFAPIVRLAIASREVCGIDKSERVLCYGDQSNYGSQPGPAIGKSASFATSLARGATAIALSDWKVAAVDRDGIVWAWGNAPVPSRPSATPTRIAFPR